MSNANDTTDARIRRLLPGRQVKLSEGNGFSVFAERSGNGKTLRIVRATRDGFTVISTQAF
jgi:hypothetical protein